MKRRFFLQNLSKKAQQYLLYFFVTLLIVVTSFETAICGYNAYQMFAFPNLINTLVQFNDLGTLFDNFGTAISSLFVVFIAYYYFSMRYALKSFSSEKQVDFVNTLNRLFFFEMIAVCMQLFSSVTS